jgi:hypothetical protein
MRKLVPLVLVGALVLTADLAGAKAAEPDASVKKTLDNLLSAIQANDRKAVVANATDAVKEAVTEESVENLSKTLGTRLKKGYEAIYLGQLKQSGVRVHLWKMTFKDGGDDALIRLALKDGKINGFFIQ